MLEINNPSSEAALGVHIVHYTSHDAVADGSSSFAPWTCARSGMELTAVIAATHQNLSPVPGKTALR